MRVPKFLPGYRGDGSRAWLRRITVKVFCTHLRKSKRKSKREQPVLEATGKMRDFESGRI